MDQTISLIWLVLKNKVTELCGNVVICFEIKFSAKKIHFSILQILQEAQHDTGFSLVKNPPCVRVNWAICASIVIVWENRRWNAHFQFHPFLN